MAISGQAPTIYLPHPVPPQPNSLQKYLKQELVKVGAVSQTTNDSVNALNDTVASIPPNLRTRLTEDTTFYVSTTGSDSTGDGSIGNPWLTGINASYQIIHNFDGGGNNITIQLVGSPFTPTDSFIYFGWPAVGVEKFIVRGDPANPSSFVIDGTLAPSGQGVNIGPDGIGTRLLLDGITMQNWAQAVNLQTYCFVDIGTCRLGNCDTIFDVEAQADLSGRDGTWSFFGANGQMTYVGNSGFDTNNVPIIFEAGTTFSFAVLNADVNGQLSIYTDNITGTCTGPRVFINRGANINGKNSVTGDVPVSSLPGNSDGINIGGTYNGSSLTPALLVSALPVLPGTLAGGERLMVTDANATTFGSVVAGSGSNVVPVYNDGANNWRIG